MPNPIVVLGTPRSGTSLVAGLLGVHGVWYGNAQWGRTNRHPKGDFVNKRISDAIEYIDKNNITNKNRIVDIVQTAAVNDGYSYGNWLIKQKTTKWDVLKNLEPIWVLVRRDLESTYKSQVRSDLIKDKKPIEKRKHRSMWLKHNDIMNYLNGIDVDVNEIMHKGNFKSIEEILSIIGLSFSKRRANNFIERDYWHGKN
jgi:hypothetical protein